MTPPPHQYEMSARDRRKMQKSLRSRRRENEKLIKFMNSAACMDHLWQIFSGQKQCERHRLYQSEATRRSLLWSGIGPFQLDQDDDQVSINPPNMWCWDAGPAKVMSV